MADEVTAVSLAVRPSADERAPARHVPEHLEPAVARMHRYSELTGLSLLCVDSRTGVVLAKTDSDGLEFLPAEVQTRIATVRTPVVMPLSRGITVALMPLGDLDAAELVAVGYSFADPANHPPELVLAAAERQWSQARLDAWKSRQLACRTIELDKLIVMAVRIEQQERRDQQREIEFEQLSDQLEQMYEEISLMHALTRNLQISRGPAEIAELCLLRMQDLVRASGNVIWLAEKSGTRHFLVRGELPFDEFGMARLIAHFDGHDWSTPLVRNHLAGTALASDFPKLRNLIVVPVAEGSRRFGWIVSCNQVSGREFGTVEASLMRSIATILGTHLRNIELYLEHEELLLSFVRSLVSTIDAKDPYTRGHSERVAIFARRLGEECGLSNEEIQDLYLSGLLHDIGKIGVDDGILRKTEKLTDAELECIRQHPMIGYQILNGLKNLQKILPGVRNHHEAFAGGGYPDGLTGEAIPLMARILAVADSYDAMKSDRPYRTGMPRQKIEEIFRQGADSQWDARVIDAYFRAADDIAQLAESSVKNPQGIAPVG
ncbi:MAG: HD-GYP domain-containing protein [Planctomycetaceae bacterium]